MFLQTTAQRVVGVVDAQLAVFKAHQAVEQVPVQAALLAVVPAANLVAALVVVVVAAGVFAQQVVHQGVAFGVVVQWTLDLLVFFIQQVAGRVEGEGFDAQAASAGENILTPHAVLQACVAKKEATKTHHSGVEPAHRPTRRPCAETLSQP